MSKVLTLLLLVVLSYQGYASNKPTDFDKAYTYVRDSILPRDFKQAKVLGDSLLNEANTPNQKIRSLMLLAIISTQQNNQVDALDYALQAEKEAINANDNGWEVRTAGFLSALFRDVNLYVEAIKHINIAEKANENLKHLANYPYIQFSIHGEKAAYHTNSGDFNRAIQEHQKRMPLLNEIYEPDRAFYKVTVYNDLGNCYLELKHFEKVRTHFEEALHYSQNAGNVVESSVFTGLGEVAMHNMNYPQAFEYFKKAESSLKKNTHFSAQLAFYKSFANYYKTVNKYDDALHYERLYFEVFEDKERTSKILINQLIERSLIEKKDYEVRHSLVVWIILALTGVMLVLLIYIITFKKKTRNKFDKLIKRFNDDSSQRLE